MVLASASPRRQELLGSLGLTLDIHPADIDESRLSEETPVALVERLAHEKAWHSYLKHGVGDDGFLLAADTVVWQGEVALGKPVDDQDACAMLRKLSGRTHHVSTGVCLLYQEVDGPVHEASFVDTTDVTFHALTEEQIAAYVSSGECRDKAGAYAIQGIGRLLVSHISGDYGNVVGLPTCRVVREMARLRDGDSDQLLLDLLGGTHE